MEYIDRKIIEIRPQYNINVHNIYYKATIEVIY